jgi:tryptophan halogenase
MYKGYLKIMTQRKSIVVVGGGTAGWITLSYLAATVDADLTIIHSDEIDIIGVGESTTPTVKHVADTVGVDERQWMRDARATFKYGVDFRNFGQAGSRWLHTFDDMLPHQCFSRPMTDYGKETFQKELTSVEYYLTHYQNDVSRYNRTHGPYEFLVENKLSPFNRRDQVNVSQYPGYSYHINAFEFGESLRKQTSADRFTELRRTVVDVVLGEQGVDHLLLDDGSQLRADVFFDCTGFRRLLIDRLTKFSPYKELPNNGAVWGRIAGWQTNRPYTGAHAQDSGWIWEIPTWGQVGSGYVYCRDFCDEEQATETIRQFWANQGQTWEPMRQVKFTGGRMADPSIKNVVSNGLSQSFIEPLEATSVMVTCSTVKSFVEVFNRHQHEAWTARRAETHSRIIKQFIDHTKRFVYYHYALSERNDSDYWRAVGNQPGAVEEVSDYITHLMQGKWCHKGETLLNQFNWTSMLLGYKKQFQGNLPKITADQLDEYEQYTKLLIANYEGLLKNNHTISEWLEKINA